MSPSQRRNLALRVLMEVGVVAGFAYWGFHIGEGIAMKCVLGIGAPVLGFGLWGAVDFRGAGRAAEPLRLVQELAISALAALALYATGQHALGVALAALSVVYHALVYLTGEQLLQPRAGEGGDAAGGDG